jgi:hypothetical protein
MHVAVIGGINHIGPFIVSELMDAGHRFKCTTAGVPRPIFQRASGGLLLTARCAGNSDRRWLTPIPMPLST